MKFSVKEIQSIIAEKIPVGRVVPEHTEEAHFYRDTFTTNPPYASVTTKSGILESPHLKKWAAKLAAENLLENWKQVSSAIESKDDKSLDLLKKQSILSHQDQFHEAGDIGTQGHEIVERYLLEWIRTGKQPRDIKKFISVDSNLPNPIVDSRLYAISRSAEAFCNEFFVEPIASELLVSSERHKFAGTLDALMLVGKVTKEGAPVQQLDGTKKCIHTMLLFSKSRLKYKCINCGMEVQKHFALVDWKTSNSINKMEYAMQVSAYWYAFKEMTGIQPKEAIIVRLDKRQQKYEVMRLADRVGAFSAYKHTAKVYEWLVGVKKQLVPLVAKERISLYD